VSNFYIVDLEHFATASRRYTGDIHNSTVVGLFMTPETIHVKIAALKLTNMIFIARCYASAVLAMGLFLSASVCVCLSQVGVLQKRLNVGSHKQHHTIAQGL